MIRRLRRRHRATFLLLALVLPAGLALSWAARREVPAVPVIPAVAPRISMPAAEPASEILLHHGDVEVRVWIWQANTGVRIAGIRPERDLEAPDVLAYWAQSGGEDELPSDCTLLGPVAGTRGRFFELPRNTRGGRVYLYSLPHQEVLASGEVSP